MSENTMKFKGQVIVDIEIEAKDVSCAINIIREYLKDVRFPSVPPFDLTELKVNIDLKGY